MRTSAGPMMILLATSSWPIPTFAFRGELARPRRDEQLRNYRTVEPPTPTPNQPPHEPDQTPEPEPEEPVSDEPVPDAPQLMPRLTLARSVGWVIGPLRSRTPSVAERLNDQLRDDVHRDRIRAGLIDGWYYELARAIRQNIDVDPNEVIDERRRGMTTLQRLFDELRGYGQGPESPNLVPGRDPARSPLEQLDHDRAQWESCLNAPVQWMRVELRCVHSPEGSISALWITHSSQSDIVDNAAKDAVRQAARAVRPPPREIVGDRNFIVSEWAVDVGIVHPLWAVHCRLDDGQSGGGIIRRGKLLRRRVELLRVLDERHTDYVPPDRRVDEPNTTPQN